jgi:hypothetical protein
MHTYHLLSQLTAHTQYKKVALPRKCTKSNAITYPHVVMFEENFFIYLFYFE